MNDPSDAPGIQPSSVTAAPSRSRNRWKRFGPTGLLALAAVAAPPVGLVAFVTFAARMEESTRASIRESAWGVPLCVAAFSVAGGLTILPTAIMSVFCGWVFGVGVGFPTAITSLLGATLTHYLIARVTSKQRVLEAVDSHERWRTVRVALLEHGFWKAVLVVALLRLPTVPPFGATTVGLAALNVQLSRVLLGTGFGILPRTAGYVWLGSTVKTISEVGDEHWSTAAIWGGVTILVLIVFTLLGKQALQKVTRESPAAPANDRPAATDVER